MRQLGCLAETVPASGPRPKQHVGNLCRVRQVRRLHQHGAAACLRLHDNAGHNTSHPATASGTISDGTTNFALLPLQFADIGRATMGGVTVSG
jgi:hypothetical protein